MIMFEVREALRGQIAAQMRKISDELASGRAADFSEYKRLVGRLQGLRDGLDAIDAVFNKLSNEGDID